MLLRLIVNSLYWIVEGGLWLFLLTMAVLGYNNPVLVAATLTGMGLEIPNLYEMKLFSAVIVTGVSFLIAALFCSPFLILLDIRQIVLRMETKAGASFVKSGNKSDLSSLNIQKHSAVGSESRRNEPTL